jgi:hypothetical protein
MDLRKLNTDEMGQVSDSWVRQGSPARTAIEKIAMLAPLLPKLQISHEGVIAAAGLNMDAESRKLTAQASRLDDKHDELVSLLHTALTVLAKTSSQPDKITHVLNVLLPEGLQHVNYSHRAEAGHASNVAAKMTGDLLAQLKALSIGERTVLDLYQQWQEVAGQLGNVASERALLSKPAQSQASQVQNARRQWARWVSLFVETAGHAELAPETDTLLFAGLRTAVEAAKGRWHTRTEPGPGPAPTPTK